MPTREEMKNFAREIDTLVASTDLNYIEAIIEYCNQTGMEVEVASTLINNNLKSKIENDAQDLNLLPRTARLPI
jgi:hypothetical protein